MNPAAKKVKKKNSIEKNIVKAMLFFLDTITSQQS